MRALVTGAGGFVGGHLVHRLLKDGFEVRGVDIKPFEQWWQIHDRAENWAGMDLKIRENCETAVSGVAGFDYVFHLCCNMGGIGFIERHKMDCMESVLADFYMLRAAAGIRPDGFFFSSSACIYPAGKQDIPFPPALKESDAYPAMPEDGYGWEKLFMERLCRHAYEEWGLETRVARLHNCFGPQGTWTDGREKAPAALCRKVAEVKLGLSADVLLWGDGTRTRSFLWVEDCVEGILRLTDSDVREPINLGSEHAVSINELLGLIEDIAGCRVKRQYDLSAPQGVYGRTSDNTLIRELLGWEPTTSLEEGLSRTYPWIEEQVRKARGIA